MKYLRFQRLRAYENILLIYRKILKMSAEAYIFRGPFLRGLFVEGLIFGGAYLRREICFSKSIGLASLLEVNLPFLLCFTLYSRGQFSKYKPPGGLYLEGDLTEGFCVSDLGGLIFGVAYTWRGLFSEFYGITERRTKCQTHFFLRVYLMKEKCSLFQAPQLSRSARRI